MLYAKRIIISIILASSILTGCSQINNAGGISKSTGDGISSTNLDGKKKIVLHNLLSTGNNSSNYTAKLVSTNSGSAIGIKTSLTGDFENINTCPLSKISNKDKEGILKAMIHNLVSDKTQWPYYDELIRKGIEDLDRGYFDGRVFIGGFVTHSSKEKDHFFSLPKMIVVKENGKWKYVLGGQDLFPCDIIKKYIDLKNKRCLYVNNIRKCYDRKVQKIYDLINETYE